MDVVLKNTGREQNAKLLKIRAQAVTVKIIHINISAVILENFKGNLNICTLLLTAFTQKINSGWMVLTCKVINAVQCN